MRVHRFPYLCNLADGYPAKGIESHGCKVSTREKILWLAGMSVPPVMMA